MFNLTRFGIMGGGKNGVLYRNTGLVKWYDFIEGAFSTAYFWLPGTQSSVKPLGGIKDRLFSFSNNGSGDMRLYEVDPETGITINSYVSPFPDYEWATDIGGTFDQLFFVDEYYGGMHEKDPDTLLTIATYYPFGAGTHDGSGSWDSGCFYTGIDGTKNRLFLHYCLQVGGPINEGTTEEYLVEINPMTGEPVGSSLILGYSNGPSYGTLAGINTRMFIKYGSADIKEITIKNTLAIGNTLHSESTQFSIGGMKQ